MKKILLALLLMAPIALAQETNIGGAAGVTSPQTTFAGGTFTAPLLLPNGSTSAPALAFSGNTDLGLFRSSNTFTLQNAASGVTGRSYFTLDNAASSWYVTDTDVSNSVVVSNANMVFTVSNGSGAMTMTMTEANLQLDKPIWLANGTIALPTYSFVNDADMGMWRQTCGGACTQLNIQSGDTTALANSRFILYNTGAFRTDGWVDSNNWNSIQAGYDILLQSANDNDNTKGRVYVSGAQDSNGYVLLIATNDDAVDARITVSENGKNIVSSVYDGSNTSVEHLTAKGSYRSGQVQAGDATGSYLYEKYVSGGTALGNPATGGTVRITIVDTTPSISDGDVQVCGYTSGANELVYNVTCETLDISAGAGTYVTATSFYSLKAIKVSSTAGLGGGGDETDAAEWTNGPTVIYAAENLADDTLTTEALAASGLTSNYQRINCLDLLGCDLSPDAPNGSYWKEGMEFTVVIMNGSQNVIFTEDGTLKLSAASHTLDAYDTLQLVYSKSDSAWLQLSVSSN